jgi:hypothetical protein
MKSVPSSKTTLGRLIAAIATVACGAIFSATAHAALQGSAGNTQIWNKVTVSFSNSASVAQLPVSSNTAIVTVNTVNVAPTVKAFLPTAGNTDGTGATQVYSVSIMTNSNGPGTVTLAAGDGTFTNLAAGTAPAITASVTLGATVFDPTATQLVGPATTVASGASITVAVPNDGGVSDGTINGLTAGEFVYISNGTGTTYGPFTVGTVTDPAVGSGVTATPGSIVLTNSTGASIGPFTPAVGWQIVEVRTATLTVTQGAVTVPASPASWITTVTATMGATNGTATVTTTAHSSALTVSKYVRNATVGVVGTTSITAPAGIGGATYYQTAVSGKPGDTLEYLLVITNSGTGTATSVIATDPVPTYTTIRTAATYGGATSTNLSTDIFAEAWNGTLQTFIPNGSGIATVGYGKSTALVAGSTMTFYLGSGSTVSTGGTINSAGITYVIYQVIIN